MMLSFHGTLWNLELAVIPVALAYLLARGAEEWTRKQKRIPWLFWLPLAVAWFAFLPNTCYLLTEWRHFLYDPQFEALHRAADADRVQMLQVAKWGLFYLAYSGVGVLCFALSIRPIHQLLHRANAAPSLWAVPFFFLCSLGVYLGLIVRLNSWDIVKRPLYVGEVAWRALQTPLLFQTIVIFAALLWLLYLIVDIWVEGALTRLKPQSKAR